MDIQLGKTNTRKQVGRSLLTSILSMGRALAPTLGKTLGLLALAGLASEGASQLVKKISGGNIFTDVVDFGRKLEKKISGGQVGGFIVLYNTLNRMFPYKDLLTAKQQMDLLEDAQLGSDFHIRPTQMQLGRGLGIILATIGIPLAILYEWVSLGLHICKRWCHQLF